jgi:hypothetical protein
LGGIGWGGGASGLMEVIRSLQIRPIRRYWLRVLGGLLFMFGVRGFVISKDCLKE